MEFLYKKFWRIFVDIMIRFSTYFSISPLELQEILR